MVSSTIFSDIIFILSLSIPKYLVLISAYLLDRSHVVACRFGVPLIGVGTPGDVSRVRQEYNFQRADRSRGWANILVTPLFIS